MTHLEQVRAKNNIPSDPTEILPFLATVRRNGKYILSLRSFEDHTYSLNQKGLLMSDFLNSNGFSFEIGKGSVRVELKK